jgi:hypothetical protein
MEDFDNDMMRDSFAYNGDDQLAAWEKYRTKFLLANRDTRINELRLVDTWLDAPKPRKDFASIWAKKREMLALHNDLIKIGR